MEESPLFEDIKAAQSLERSVDLFRSQANQEVEAAERGRRIHPDGTFEDYERLEFRRK